MSRAVSDPEFVYDRLLALQAVPSPIDNDGEVVHIKARVKALALEEHNLVAALKTAPSATEGITGELEKIASERKSLERRLEAMAKVDGHKGQVSVDPGAIKAFCQAVKPFLKAMGVEQRQKLLSLLDFEAIVSEAGEVKASIAVPSTENLFTTGQTSA